MITGSRVISAALAAATALGIAAATSPDALAATNWRPQLDTGSVAQAQAGPLPPAPTGIGAACSSLLGISIDVTWAPVPNATSYTVYRSTTSATSGFSVAATVAATAPLSFLDRNLVLLPKTYWYRVTATVGDNWVSPPSVTSPPHSLIYWLFAWTCT